MDSKVTSILSYLGILWLVAFFAGTKDEKSIYHLRQGFGLLVVGFVAGFILGIVLSIVPSLSFLGGILGLLFLALLVIGIINVTKDEQKPLPFFGKSFENIGFIK